MPKQRLVNWTGTMELSDKIFRQTEDFFLDAIADGAMLGLRNYNYGLLPSRSGDRIYNGIRVSEHITDRIEVQLNSCDAITSSGFRINFGEDNPLMKHYSPSEDKNLGNRNIRDWDIILSVDPFHRIPVGTPDPEETPPRHPDAESSYALYVMPKGEINTMESGRHHLTIGRIHRDGDRYSVDTQYIPPCTSMSSHPELSEYYDRFAEMFNSIEKSSKAIVGKMHGHSNRSDLERNIQTVCRNVMRYIACIYFDLRNRGRLSAPIEIVNYVSSTAHTVYSELSLLATREKVEMLKYFHEWADVSPAAFEKLLSDALDIIYDHNDIRATMKCSDDFLHTFSKLWACLAGLEFIGQHKESIVVSEREAERKASVGTDSWLIEQ
jgi:hypothetical protein